MLAWEDFVMEIEVEMQMSATPPRDMYSLLELEQSHGIVRGNQQLPYLPRR